MLQQARWQLRLRLQALKLQVVSLQVVSLQVVSLHRSAAAAHQAVRISRSCRLFRKLRRAILCRKLRWQAIPAVRSAAHN